MSDFAKAQLLKYGWSEGKGLGKNENGIVDALKPKLKFDTTGVGHKDVDFQWWNSVYDKALKNIVLEKSADNVAISVAKENAFNISTSQSGLEGSKKKYSLQYGNFLKTSTLQDGSMVKDGTCQSIEDDTKDDSFIIKMTDEELFKACGGRTGHKGARHGLTLNGKLARIAEQEKQLMATALLKSNEESSQCSKIKQKKKKKRRKSIDVNNRLSLLKDDSTDEELNEHLALRSKQKKHFIATALAKTSKESSYCESKKRKKRKKNMEVDDMPISKDECISEDECVLIVNGFNHVSEQDKQLIAAKFLKSNKETSQPIESRKKKKKKAKKNMEVEDCTSGVNDDNVSDDDCFIVPPIAKFEDFKPSKESRKKVREKIHNLTHQLNKSCMLSDEEQSSKEELRHLNETFDDKPCKSKCKNKKKSKRKRDQEILDNNSSDIQILDDDVPMEPCTKKKRCTFTLADESALEENEESSKYDVCITDNSSLKTGKNKKKSKKNKDHQPSKDRKYNYCPSAEALKLNTKIRIKKIKKYEKKEERKFKLAKLTEDLLSISLNSVEDNTKHT